MSFLAEQAGGKGSDGSRRVLDIQPEQVRPFSLSLSLSIPKRMHKFFMFCFIDWFWPPLDIKAVIPLFLSIPKALVHPIPFVEDMSSSLLEPGKQRFESVHPREHKRDEGVKHMFYFIHWLWTFITINKILIGMSHACWVNSLINS